MIQAMRRLLGWIGLPVGADADPVIERMQHHDDVVAELKEARILARQTRRSIEREDGLVVSMVRGTRRRRQRPQGNGGS